MASPLLCRHLLPFLLLLCFLSLQMRLFVFRPDIHLPAETAGFRRYGWHFFQYETRELSILVHWLVRYKIDFLGSYQRYQTQINLLVKKKKKKSYSLNFINIFIIYSRIYNQWKENSFYVIQIYHIHDSSTHVS